jgi:hypothetical protein
MADSLRLRGQEIQVRVTKNGVLQRTMTAVESLTWTPKVDILRKGYLGETTDRRDDIYKGSAIEMTIDPESQDAFTLIQLIRDRASRRTAQSDAHINIVFTANFPNGQRPRVTLPDVKFQDPSITVQSRDAYVGMRLSGECEDFVLSGI